MPRYARSRDEYRGLFGFVECVWRVAKNRGETGEREKGAPKEQRHVLARGSRREANPGIC